MKQLFYFFLVAFLLQAAVPAQVPNGGFENWTGGNPDGWLTNNVPGVVTPITQSNSSYSGSSAAKGQVETYMGSVVSPILLSTNMQGLGFPISTRYNSLKGYFKFTPVEGDLLDVIVLVTLNGQELGGGAVEISGSLASYTEINIPIEYIAAGTPDTAIIAMSVSASSGDPHVGSEFYVDELSLSEAVVGVNDFSTPYAFNLSQNYPNPFNPSTLINYSVPERSDVSLKVYNILGNEVATLVAESKEAGTYTVKFDASSLPSGVYVYAIRAGNYSSSRKMILMK